MKATKPTAFAPVPLKWIGPIEFAGPEFAGLAEVPLATYEAPLWPSTDRGARVSRHAGGIRAVIAQDHMARSILLEAPDAQTCLGVIREVAASRRLLEEVVAETSRFAKLVSTHSQIVGNLLYLRLEFETGDAAGHNMTTLAAQRVGDWLVSRHPTLKFTSVSGNYCTDKKVSAVNGILGRGKYVVAELDIPRKICERFLKTTPERISELNLRKNWMGSSLAGGVRTANAHFANMLLAVYLATGQDAANIVEGSQGFVHAQAHADHLYFSVTLPNIIVGTTGAGKTHDFVRENLARMGCLEDGSAGAGARRLAVLVAGAVLCGELSLLAAQTNPGELVRAHLKLERE